MTDKEKIRAEVERRYNEKDRLGDDIRANVYKSILRFIDYMQEEPVSEELEEAAKRYATEGDEISGLYVIDELVDAFKAGANWQKQQILDCNTTLQRTFELGKQEMEQQMMAKAVDVEVKVDAGGYPYVDRVVELYDYDKDIPLAKEGDKYKVILIKEG